MLINLICVCHKSRGIYLLNNDSKTYSVPSMPIVLAVSKLEFSNGTTRKRFWLRLVNVCNLLAVKLIENVKERVEGTDDL